MINNYRRKLELKDDMYIRTSYGRIDKILELDDSYVKGVSQKNNSYVYDLDSIVKASYNIIDILKVGDYVNGYKITEIIEKPRKCLKTEYKINLSYVFFCFYEKDIKSIVTHEQMEQMAYKVVE